VYNVTLEGNSCIMDLAVSAGSVLGNNGKVAASVLTYGVYNVRAACLLSLRRLPSLVLTLPPACPPSPPTTTTAAQSSLVASRSISTDPSVCFTPSWPKTVIINGNFAAVAILTGLYDKAANKVRMRV
jgi:hypothetical protein